MPIEGITPCITRRNDFVVNKVRFQPKNTDKFDHFARVIIRVYSLKNKPV
jgi:hypothetical protein